MKFDNEKIKKVFMLALPVVGEMLLYMLIWVVDTALIGKWGGDVGVSAVGFSSEIMYTAANVFIAMGIGIGVTTMVAQKTGAGKKDKAEEFLSQGLVIGTVISGLIAAILIIFPIPILKLGGASGEVLQKASEFMRVGSIGLLFNMICSILNAGLRGIGKTVISLITSIIVNVVAISLDIVLIFGKLGFPEMGVLGSAIATTCAYICGFIFLLIYYTKVSKFKVRFKYIKEINKECMGRIIRLAIPSGFQEAAFSVSRLVGLGFIMYIGKKAFAANQITTTIESLSFMPGWGFAAAATTLVGQKIGAKEYKTAREYALIAMVFGVIIMMFFGGLFILVPRFLMGLFIDNKETIDIGVKCLLFAAIEQPFMALAMVLEGALRGAGDTKTPFLIALISSWLIRIPLMYAVLFIFKLDVSYVWLVTAIQWTFEGILAYILFNRKSKKWEKDLCAN